MVLLPIIVIGQSWDQLSVATAEAYHAGQYDLAFNIAQKTIQQAEQEFGTRHANYFSSVGDLASILKKKGQNAEALKIEQKNLQDIELAFGREHLTYITALKNLGNTCLELEEFQQAESYYNMANSSISKIISKQDHYYRENGLLVFDAHMAVSLQLGVLYHRMGRIVDAEQIYSSLIEFCKSYLGEQYSEYVMYPVLINNISNVFIDKGEFEKAEPYLVESLQLTEKMYGLTSPYYLQTAMNIATVYKNTKRYEQAEQLLTKTLETLNRTQEPGTADHIHVLNNRAELFINQERYAESERDLLEAMGWQEKNFGKDHPMYQTLVHNLAETYQWMNRYDEADQLYKIAVKKVITDVEKNFAYLTESEKRNFYMHNVLFVNEYANFALLRSGALPLPGLPTEQFSKTSLADLFDLQLNTKALLLNASTKMKKSLMNSGDSMLIARFQLWEQLKDKIARQYNLPNTSRGNLDSLISQAEFYESVLNKSSAAFRKGFVNQSVSWKDIQKKLKPGEAAVEIIRYYEGLIYVALIITPETKDHPQIAIVKSSKSKYLDKEYISFYKNAIRLKVADTTSYNRFWKPVMDTLKRYARKVKRVYVSPDGIYNEINLNTLRNPVTGKYVIDETEIHLTTNTREILSYTDQRKFMKGKAVLLGRPDYGVADTAQVGYTRASFGDLEGTEKEVNGIAVLLRNESWNTAVLMRGNATEEAVKNIHNPQLLHLATHGFFVPPTQGQSQPAYLEAMLQSGIILAWANRPSPGGEDGILTAYESMNLDLDSTQLVVLSACETGLGSIEAGEGVYGLQRTLKVAGAQTILMSLWKVDDAATQELMILFYEKLLNGMSMNRAFREAQQALREKYDQPYYWGAFVMAGG